MNYLTGTMYREDGFTDCTICDGGIRVHFGEIDIGSETISGFQGYWLSNYQDIIIRRKGARVKVSGEEQYLSKRQEAYDKREAAWKEQLKGWLERQRAERVGRDAVAIRGTAPLQTGTGTHTWCLQWAHAPAQAGAGDAVGLFADGTSTARSRAGRPPRAAARCGATPTTGCCHSR